MKRFWLLALAWFCWAPIQAQQVIVAPEHKTHERYEITFYGIELPREGAHLLLVIDVSKSMSRKDGARTTPGRRWDTLLDEVQAMQEAMHEVAKRGVPFQVSVIFEGGDVPHKGEGPFNMADAAAGEALVTLLKGQKFKSGGNFEVTFGETLWDVVARQAITYVIYLGDDDIGTYAEAVRESLARWYTPPEKPDALTRKCQKQKANWRLHWKHWRPTKRGQPSFSTTKRLPPPSKDVTFSCVAIGQSSPLLEELAKTGRGKYIERKTTRKSKKK